jgi:hypothetical protein
MQARKRPNRNAPHLAAEGLMLEHAAIIGAVALTALMALGAGIHFVAGIVLICGMAGLVFYRIASRRSVRQEDLGVRNGR